MTVNGEVRCSGPERLAQSALLRGEVNGSRQKGNRRRYCNFRIKVASGDGVRSCEGVVANGVRTHQ